MKGGVTDVQERSPVIQSRLKHSPVVPVFVLFQSPCGLARLIVRECVMGQRSFGPLRADEPIPVHVFRNISAGFISRLWCLVMIDTDVTQSWLKTPLM